MLNLFGEDQEPDKKTIGHYKIWRAKNEYGKSLSLERQCRNCTYKRSFDYHNKCYHKCELQGISQSEASDIRLSNVCEQWWRKTNASK